MYVILIAPFISLCKRHVSIRRCMKWWRPQLLFLFLLATSMPAAGSAWHRSLADGDTALNNAADSSTVVIDKIFVVGNRKTKERIILRELDIMAGQAYTRAELDELIAQDRKKILNTRLFLTVDVSVVALDADLVDVIIRVSERWYFFPIPIFNLADRNFTEWWVNQGRDLSRVEYGLQLRQFNFRGRNETLSLLGLFGFTKQMRLSYQVPYIDNAQKMGLTLAIDYSANKNVRARTQDHLLQFIGADFTLLEQLRTGAFFTYRPDFYSYHELGLFTSFAYAADTLVQENPNYFSASADQQKYIGISYGFTNDRRDYVGYPLSGSFSRFDVSQIGLGLFRDVGIFRMAAQHARYMELGKQFYFSTNLSGLASFPDRQPYFNYSGLGQNDAFIRGYERYVIEGQHFILNNNSLKRRLFAWEYDMQRLIPIRQFSKIPIAAYFTVNFDHGYVANYAGYESNTRFTDRYLMGGGLGIDIVSFYDFVMRWEYSINVAGERGLYLNIQSAF
jgi:hypothetical protein